MTTSSFKVVAGARDWGSPLNEQPTFESLEDAQANAREYIFEQRRMGGPAVAGTVMIEETRADGSVVSHPVS